MTSRTEKSSKPTLTAEPGDTLANAVRRHLGDAILSGVYAPGSRLEEIALARRLGVSRTPVREALRQLAAADIVTIRPNAGAMVLAVTGERLPVLLEAVVEIEALCTRMATSRLQLGERLALRAAFTACETAVAAGDTDTFAAQNRLFHETIVKGTHNSDIEAAATALRVKAAPFRKAQFRRAGRMAELHEIQREVLAAIEIKDAEGAFALMRRCLEDEMAAILGMFTGPK